MAIGSLYVLGDVPCEECVSDEAACLVGLAAVIFICTHRFRGCVGGKDLRQEGAFVLFGLFEGPQLTVRMYRASPWVRASTVCCLIFFSHGCLKGLEIFFSRRQEAMC